MDKNHFPTTKLLSTDETQVSPSRVRRTYLGRTPRSAQCYERAARCLAGGTSRQTAHWFPYPLTFTRGEGCRVWDIDGHSYIDLINNYTSLIHGHAYPPVVEIVRDRVGKGTAWPANNVDQVALAEQLVDRVASIDSLRFTNSGSEAANLALHIVRAATGRSKLLMARAGYHGMIQEFLLGSMNQTGPNTCIARFNDAASFREQLELHGHDIAGVFLEPMLGAGGVLCATPEFLREVIAVTHAAGAYLVLDEVQTLRMAPGGLQQMLGVTPDLTVLGKFIGGGLPLGAVGGRRELMELFDPLDLKVYHSGTFNGNSVAAAAGAATVRDVTADRIAHMGRLAGRLRMGLLQAAAHAALPLTVNQLGSLLNLFFMPQAPETAWSRTDQEIMQRFHLASLNRGLFFASRGYLVMSTVMTDADIDEAIARAADAMNDVAAEL